MGLPTDPCPAWSFAVIQSAVALADREPVAPSSPGVAAGDLLALFGLVSDGRPGQGRDHPVAAVLALAAAAVVVAGMRGYTAIAGWVQDVPPPVLADLYLRAGASPLRPPSKATIWRVITDPDAASYVRGQWAIEAWHWLRDTLYREDHSQFRTRSGPRMMAALVDGDVSARLREHLPLLGCLILRRSRRFSPGGPA